MAHEIGSTVGRMQRSHLTMAVALTAARCGSSATELHAAYLLTTGAWSVHRASFERSPGEKRLLARPNCGRPGGGVRLGARRVRHPRPHVT